MCKGEHKRYIDRNADKYSYCAADNELKGKTGLAALMLPDINNDTRFSTEANSNIYELTNSDFVSNSRTMVWHFDLLDVEHIFTDSFYE
jgi:hypothetical protein